MSYGTDMMIWVGDLDGYINIDAINRENDLEKKKHALNAELNALGDVSLFSNNSISYLELHSCGVNLEQWRWTLHRAEKSLGQMDTDEQIEKAFLKATMSAVRRYAVARYAAFEGLSFESAITAIFPHGVRALLFSYIAGEPLLSDTSCRKEIQLALHLAASTKNITAYDRVGLVRRRIHELAINHAGSEAHLKLDKNRMRNILSLLRLYYTNLECQVQTVAELLEIQLRYEAARTAEKRGLYTSPIITGKKIKNWRLRFLQPLTFYFPYSARHALKRLTDQPPSRTGPMDKKTAANELALIYCGIELMRKHRNKR